jgi:hypothetical protein
MQKVNIILKEIKRFKILSSNATTFDFSFLAEIFIFYVNFQVFCFFKNIKPSQITLPVNSSKKFLFFPISRIILREFQTVFTIWFLILGQQKNKIFCFEGHKIFLMTYMKLIRVAKQKFRTFTRSLFFGRPKTN